MESIRKYVKTILILGCIIAILAFFTYARLSPKGIFSDLQNDLKAIEPADSSPYTDLDGNLLDLRTYRGKPLVINSWATWSPFSKDVLPVLKEIQVEYQDRVHVLAINRMEDTVLVRSYLVTYGIEPSELFVIDSSDNFYRTIGGYAMPETVVYGVDGTILFHKRGVITKDEITAVLDTALGE